MFCQRHSGVYTLPRLAAEAFVPGVATLLSIADVSSDVIDSDDASHECECCEASFDSEVALRRHLRSVGIVD